MKELKAEFEYPEYSIGTLNWFNDILNHSKFAITNAIDGFLAIYLITDNGGGIYTHSFLCRKATDDTNSSYMLTDDGYACAYPQQTCELVGFEKEPLTPACKKAIEELIMKAKEIFAEWYENEQY